MRDSKPRAVAGYRVADASASARRLMVVSVKALSQDDQDASAGMPRDRGMVTAPSREL